MSGQAELYADPTPLQLCLMARMNVERYNEYEGPGTQIDISFGREQAMMAMATYMSLRPAGEQSGVDKAELQQAETMLVGATRAAAMRTPKRGASAAEQEAYTRAIEAGAAVARMYGFTHEEGLHLMYESLDRAA